MTTVSQRIERRHKQRLGEIQMERAHAKNLADLTLIAAKGILAAFPDEHSPYELAEAAVAALDASGVVFASMSDPAVVYQP